MNDYFALTVALIGGLALGAFFYVGLWWTVVNRLSSQFAGLWFSGSLFVRLAVVAAGFWVLSAGHWERAALCLAGFVAARFVVSKLTTSNQKAGHAS